MILHVLCDTCEGRILLSVVKPVISDEDMDTYVQTTSCELNTEESPHVISSRREVLSE